MKKQISQEKGIADESKQQARKKSLFDRPLSFPKEVKPVGESEFSTYYLVKAVNTAHLKHNNSELLYFCKDAVEKQIPSVYVADAADTASPVGDVGLLMKRTNIITSLAEKISHLTEPLAPLAHKIRNMIWRQNSIIGAGVLCIAGAVFTSAALLEISTLGVVTALLGATLIAYANKDTKEINELKEEFAKQFAKIVDVRAYLKGVEGAYDDLAGMVDGVKGLVVAQKEFDKEVARRKVAEKRKTEKGKLEIAVPQTTDLAGQLTGKPETAIITEEEKELLTAKKPKNKITTKKKKADVSAAGEEELDVKINELKELIKSKIGLEYVNLYKAIEGGNEEIINELKGLLSEQRLTPEKIVEAIVSGAESAGRLKKLLQRMSAVEVKE
ncbi:Na+/H+ antiporter NhaA [Candidatus Parvarchaeota archaeon]|nr:Na+/H+ antiporter NhaA [Candidatus Parvarchaeota archaeon]